MRHRPGGAGLTAGAVRQECTQIGGNGLSAPFRGIRVHCCDAICRDVNPHEPPKSTQLTQFIEYLGICSALTAGIQKSAGAPGQCPAAPANVPRWSAATCSPTDSLRSTIGARGLNFRVRHGTGCASPAMAADQRGTFSARGAGLAPCPQGRTAGLKTTLPRRSRGPGSGKRRARPISAARLSASRRLHLRPITSWSTRGLTEGRTHLGTGFPLRCFQRLSQPDSATGRCRWSTTRAPEVRPPRSSRTRGSLPQFSYAR